MKNRIRDIFAVTLLISLAGFSAYKGMQVLAIFSMLGILGVLYKRIMHDLIDIGFNLLRAMRQAKLGELEFQIEEKLKDFSNLAAKNATWVPIVLSQLSSEHIGLLMSIHKAGKYGPSGAAKRKLRDLRARGLVAHNRATMADSTEVWLSPLGNELVNVLLESPIEFHSIEAGASDGDAEHIVGREPR